jgi:hypothetical protein
MADLRAVAEYLEDARTLVRRFGPIVRTYF